jgi:purine-binding chemotaxis protein CheW
VEPDEDLDESFQVLTFRVCDQQHAIRILDVKEIVPFTTITQLPRTPDAVLGLLNLRGGAVPVVSLARGFGLPEEPPGRRSCVIVLEVVVDGDATVVGILADGVNNVISVRPEEIEPAPRFGTDVPHALLDGMVRLDGDFVPLLNVREVLAGTGFGSLEAIPTQTSDPALQPAESDPLPTDPDPGASEVATPASVALPRRSGSRKRSRVAQ